MTIPAPVSRLPNVGTTIFTVMSQLALKHGAVNLGQGFPDFNCDARLQQCLAEAVQCGPQPIRADDRRASAALGHR